MKKTDRTIQLERRTPPTREPIVLRAPAPSPGPIFLKPSFAISAQRGGLVVSVSARPAKDSVSKA